MTARTFTVEKVKRRGSAAGDKIRSGRVQPSARAGHAAIVIDFEERPDGCIYCTLRKAEVGVICRQPQGARPGFNWLCFLPEQRRSPQFAADLDKAKDALRVTVETWCEAAGLGARAKHPHRHPGQTVGWRAGEGE